MPNKQKLSYAERRRQWWTWHKANPHVWELFEQFALDVVRRGIGNTSHWLVMNRVRWETSIATTVGTSDGDEFMINNGYIGWYARLWMVKHPEHRRLLEVHQMDGEPREVLEKLLGIEPGAPLGRIKKPKPPALRRPRPAPHAGDPAGTP